MSLLDTASLIVTPNGYKEGKLYSVIPSDGSGDMSVTRATTATRVNSAGLVESIGNNIPRLDYSNGTCPSLLVEPQRTNLALYSSSFDNAYWNKRAGISISADTTTAPNGTLTADTVNYSSGDGYTYFFDTLTPSASHTISVYAKGSGTLTFQAYWGTGASTGSANTLTSEWQRFSFTFTTGSTTALGDFGFFVPNTCNIWGAQLELGSYATSYIPTLGASVTRNADVISKTGISSLIGQTEGTLFQDIYIDDILNAGSYYSFLAIGTTGNLMFMTVYPDGRIQFALYNGNVLQVNIDAPSYGLTTGRHKMAVAYKNNDFAFYCDGNLVGTANSGSVPATSKIDLTDTLGGKQRYNAAALWKTRLTNAQLATLTTI